MMEVIFDPIKADAVQCNTALGKDYRMYGAFFIGFCGCNVAGNDYMSLGLSDSPTLGSSITLSQYFLMPQVLTVLTLL